MRPALTRFLALLDDAMRENGIPIERKARLEELAIDALVDPRTFIAYFHPVKKTGERRLPQNEAALEVLLRSIRYFRGIKQLEDDPKGREIFEAFHKAQREKQAQRHADRPQAAAASAADAAMGAARQSAMAAKGPASPIRVVTGHSIDTQRVDIGAIAAFAPKALIGRDAELDRLNRAWHHALAATAERPRVLTFHALGGEGKTSLVAKWVLDLLRLSDGPIASPVFAWSFYNQGTDDKVASSSDAFLNAALTFLGDTPVTSGAQNAFAKAERLAQLADARGALLILDGIEPLQWGPGSSMSGRLKDEPLALLLETLAGRNLGLCVVTTRYAISNLESSGEIAAPQCQLPPLTRESGVDLLQAMRHTVGKDLLQLQGLPEEFEAVSQWSRGHALTLTLTGSYLLLAHQGDLRKFDLVRLEEADNEVSAGPTRSGHAFRIMDAYMHWFDNDGDRGRRASVVLRLLGLFDRPATVQCLRALLSGDGIAGLTESLPDPTAAQLDIVCNRLAAAGLLTCIRGDELARSLIQVDAHPLIREYFERHLRRDMPLAWRDANKRLFEHLCSIDDPAEPTDPARVEPLYQAIVHGCRAGLHQTAFEDVFWHRICRGNLQVSTSRFGAVNSDLAALSNFFDRPWDRPAKALREDYRMRVASLAAFRLRTAARYAEAVPLMRDALRYFESASEWQRAAGEAGNLSVLWMHAGELDESVACARTAVAHAKKLADRKLLSDRMATLADPYVQMGPPARDLARAAFEEAEALQKEVDPGRPLLHSTKGYRLHWFLLDLGEYDEVISRTERTESWTSPDYELLDRGLNYLMRGRAYMLRAGTTADESDWRLAREWIDKAAEPLRRSSFQEVIILTLLAQAELRALHGGLLEQAETDLRAAWEIALRGPMPLQQADILLLRCRLFHRANGRPPRPYPWGSAAEDLESASALILRHRYGRRSEEVDRLRQALAADPKP